MEKAWDPGSQRASHSGKRSSGCFEIISRQRSIILLFPQNSAQGREFKKKREKRKKRKKEKGEKKGKEKRERKRGKRKKNYIKEVANFP